jgi:hypothetical protein
MVGGVHAHRCAVALVDLESPGATVAKSIVTRAKRTWNESKRYHVHGAINTTGC